MSGWPLATVWVAFLIVVALLAQSDKVTWPVAAVFGVAALFIALTMSAADRAQRRP